MDWEDVAHRMDEWTVKTAGLAQEVRKHASLVFTNADFGYYLNPESARGALFARNDPSEQDTALCKKALDRVVPVEKDLLTLDQLSEEPWVKVATSPFLRRAGELLNFFPGKYPGGIPNAPSPLAATLTGGLVGAGLGYGAGWLGEKVLPKDWKKGRLRRTLAMLGGAAGAAPGLLWSGSALQRGRSLLDGSDVTDNTQIDPADVPKLASDLKWSSYARLVEKTDDIPLGERYTWHAAEHAKFAFDTFGTPIDPLPKSPIHVDMNRMGQTLWDVGAPPGTAATTMGALYAASQMPDPRARPGQVTPHQTGLLGTMMGAAGGGLKGYATGYLAGKALGILTGAPSGVQNTIRNTGLALGVINSVVPRLFR